MGTEDLTVNNLKYSQNIYERIGTEDHPYCPGNEMLWDRDIYDSQFCDLEDIANVVQRTCSIWRKPAEDSNLMEYIGDQICLRVKGRATTWITEYEGQIWLTSPSVLFYTRIIEGDSKKNAPIFSCFKKEGIDIPQIDLFLARPLNVDFSFSQLLDWVTRQQEVLNPHSDLA